MPAFLRITSGVLAASSLASAASAVITVGHGRIESSVQARADYDSNIFTNSSEKSDEIFTLTPEVHYVRDRSVLTTDLALGVNLVRFSDNTDQNSEDPYFKAHIGYAPSDKTTFNSDIDVRRTSQADETINDRVSSNTYGYNGLFQYLFSEKLGYRVTGDYSLQDYRTSGYSDVQSFSIGLDAVYIYSSKLTALAGVSYGESETTNRSIGHGNPSSKDYRYSVGLEGVLAPKVTGTVRVGLANRQFDESGFSDSSAVYLSTGVKWAATQKTTFSLEASNDFATTAGDQSSKTLSIFLGVEQKLTEKLSADGGVGYQHANYTPSGTGVFAVPGRSDDSGYARVRLAYAFTAAVSGDLSAAYRNTDSTLATSTYERVNFGASVIVRF